MISLLTSFKQIRLKLSRYTFILNIRSRIMQCEAMQSAMKILNRSRPDRDCEVLARSIVKMKQSYKKHESIKQSRTIIVLDETPAPQREQKHVDKTCQALTLKGVRCSFKAVNGCYCKKHSINDKSVVLGKSLKNM